MRKILTLSVAVLIAATLLYQSARLRSEGEESALSSLNPSARGRNSVVATTSATIVAALAVTGQTQLRFGIIRHVDSAGTITITPDNHIAVRGAIDVPKGERNPFQAAEFHIQGAPHKDYRIHLPTELFFNRREGAAEKGATRLRVDNFRSESAMISSAAEGGRLNAKGEDIVRVGGTLHVPAGAAPGSYSGLVPMTVEY